MLDKDDISRANLLFQQKERLILDFGRFKKELKKTTKGKPAAASVGGHYHSIEINQNDEAFDEIIKVVENHINLKISNIDWEIRSFGISASTESERGK